MNNPTTPIVYVPHHDGRLYIGDLTRYGSPIILFDRDLYPDDVDERIAGVMTAAYTALRHFDPMRDYLALVGAPPYQAICCMVLGAIAGGGAGGLPPLRRRMARILRYDRHEQAYYPIDLDL